jgi:hypothetical protein
LKSTKRDAVIAVSEKILKLTHARDEMQESLRKAESDLQAANEELDDLLATPSAFGLKNVVSSVQPEVQSIQEGCNGSKSARKEPPNKPLYDYVARNPVVDYGQAAQIVYGKDTEANRANVSAKLYYLKKLGWITKGENRNEWRIANPNGSEASEGTSSAV